MIRTFYSCLIKDVGVLDYFLKTKEDREHESLGTNALGLLS